MYTTIPNQTLESDTRVKTRLAYNTSFHVETSLQTLGDHKEVVKEYSSGDTIDEVSKNIERDSLNQVFIETGIEVPIGKDEFSLLELLKLPQGNLNLVKLQSLLYKL